MNIEKQLTDMQVGNSLLTRVRKVKDGKFQIELAEKIQRVASTNVLAILNAGDERFDKNALKARRGWLIAEKAHLITFFGIGVAALDALPEPGTPTYDDASKRWLTVGILNPSIMDSVTGNKEPLAVQISETITPTDHQAASLDTSAKRNGSGADSEFIVTPNGEHIFSNTSIRARKDVKHIYVEGVLQSELVSAPATNLSEMVEDVEPAIG